jgi:gliding motility-associated-like protein
VNLGIFTKQLKRILKSFMSIATFYYKISCTLFFFGMAFAVSAQTASTDPCKDVWVATDSKILMFSPEPGEVIQPILVPVNGSLNPLIEWTWTPALGMVDKFGNDGSHLLQPYFDIQKLGDLGGNAFKTTFIISGKAPSLGCNKFAAIDVIILARVKPYDAITPNGDDLNDYWSIDNISSYPEATITVIDRWGIPVFEGRGDTYEERPFRGKLDGKLLPTGVYMYRIKPNADYPDVVGSLTIIR